MFDELHKLANYLKRYSFSDLGKLQKISNGIYLVFEKGEKIGELDRIVRVGSHPSNGRFFKRLNDHFNNRQRNSIMRKHIGRCFLKLDKDPYLQVWDLSNVQVKKGSFGANLLDARKEAQIESRISKYLENLSFCIIPELNDDAQRIFLETKLIATLNQSSRYHISLTWLGRNHPNSIISEGGLWNIQGMNSGNFLSPVELALLKVKTKNEQA